MTLRPPWTLIAAAIAVLLGMAGLVRGSLPQSSADGGVGTTVQAITVGGAYVREPANDVNAAAYFTVYNSTDAADTLTSVTSGAGAQASLHTEVNGAMQLNAAGLVVPAHSTVSLSPGLGHVMIEQLYGPIKKGQTVNLQLTFARAGQILVTAPVIGVSDPAPTAGASVPVGSDPATLNPATESVIPATPSPSAAAS
jgi:hypothetical protein